MKRRKKLNISLFSETALTILVSVATLLLQSISFATTWNGAKIYLENIFPYAALFFAIAIQSTAYFFSNSLRRKASFLKVVAVLTAMCCSTSYSYIGIYNSVNSPVTYLQENYTQIAQELTLTYKKQLEETLTTAQEAVNDASSRIIARYTALTGKTANITACRTALEGASIEYTSNMRAPRQSAYETYEEYATAYQAYINSISQSKNAEADALRSSTLSSYGFTSIEALNQAEQENTASLNALKTALGITDTDDLTNNLSSMTMLLSSAISNTSEGKPLGSNTLSQLNKLFQAAKLCGYEPQSLSQLTSSLDLCAQVSGSTLMKDYTQLAETLPEGMVTDANTMILKASMDAEIMTAILKLNSLLPEAEQLSHTAEEYRLTDLYLIPIQALQQKDTRMTAGFSLAVAALIDTLSLLFALSLRGRKPLWKRRTLLFNQMEEYAPLIYASLPAMEAPLQALSDFLNHFTASPQTEIDGYMLQTNMQSLQGYHSLAALLCQINLAKIIPAGFLENEEEILLLKARFVFWANSMIYEEHAYE
ncbi:MAG: hypothetical protein IJ379_11790 [Lachnospiraceae bacterium]|nr:hypothetical protein [Lachnospiraceae bacterium]